jgi:hypothetical protein
MRFNPRPTPRPGATIIHSEPFAIAYGVFVSTLA